MLRLTLNHRIDGVPTDMIVGITRMEHIRTSLGQDRMVIDDFKVFAADGETPLTGYAGGALMEIEFGFADALLPASVEAAGRADKPAILVNAVMIGGVETDVVVKVGRMAVYIDRFGRRRVRLDDWGVFAIDGEATVDDEIDDPAGDQLPGLVEAAIEDCLVAAVPSSEAA